MEELAPAVVLIDAETLGFLEVLDNAGNVAERVKITSLPIHIGRAYDNDVIVADPYICPHHARISADESGCLSAEDLGSVNGMFENANKNRVTVTALTPGARIRLGHTRLRFISLDYAVSPTLEDHHAHRFRGLYENRLSQILIFAVTIAALWASSFFETVERREASEPAFELVLPVVFILLWAGVWGFAGRVITHRTKFLVHCAVVSVALLTIFVFDTALEYLAFALSLDHVRNSLSGLGGLAILGLALYSHLRFATLASRLRLGIVAGAISVSIIGLVALKFHVESTEFSSIPHNRATLKAPMFRFVEGESADDFFARIDELRDDVVAQTSESTH